MTGRQKGEKVGGKKKWGAAAREAADQGRKERDLTAQVRERDR